MRVVDFVPFTDRLTSLIPNIYETGVISTDYESIIWDTSNAPPGMYYLMSDYGHPFERKAAYILVATPSPTTYTLPVASTANPRHILVALGDTVVFTQSSGLTNIYIDSQPNSDSAGTNLVREVTSVFPFTWSTSGASLTSQYKVTTDNGALIYHVIIVPRPAPPPPYLSCPNCSAGTYSLAGNTACTDCGYGYYSAAVSSVCTVCPVGTKCNSTTTSAPVSCGLGNYQGSTGQSFCSTCPLDQYCGSQTTSVPISCPAHTTASAGSYTLLQCRCVQGYVCSYTKRITTVVTLNTTLSRFNSDYGGVKTAFINAVASAAGVPSSQVTINTVTSSGGRRLLSFGDRGSIEVKVVVEGAERLHNLAGHLAKHNVLLHQGHTWEESHSLQSSPEAPVFVPVFPVSGMRRPGSL